MIENTQSFGPIIFPIRKANFFSHKSPGLRKNTAQMTTSRHGFNRQPLLTAVKIPFRPIQHEEVYLLDKQPPFRHTLPSRKQVLFPIPSLGSNALKIHIIRYKKISLRNKAAIFYN